MNGRIYHRALDQFFLVGQYIQMSNNHQSFNQSFEETEPVKYVLFIRKQLHNIVKFEAKQTILYHC